ncbi:Squalene/phytoene synthase [Halteromyces radiatus]|uniref:Squalene/phytoene synthase n=1 Tax=Halteromyces radiatus TaxID=101107 RepID=UPI0022204008|nr:Squalene/phytoene synthase [Halteromyces radiatus]KAI8082896.1 Squalene/phytoene synthase [Halteromyces radiatus]
MRMQFWKDTIDKVYSGNAPQQPIALALQDSLQHANLSSMWLKRIITERMANLDDHPFMTIKEMEDYGENTASSLLYLQLESLNVRDVQVDHVVSHLGKMMGISTFLRSLPFHLAQKRLVLPVQITAKHNISQEAVMRGDIERVDDAVFEVATAAYDQLLTARSLLNTVNPEAFPVILSAIPHIRYLERLEQHDFNVFEPKLQRKDWKLPLVLWSSYRNRKI